MSSDHVLPAILQPAANSQDYPLRYHDLRRNEYLRYYKVCWTARVRQQQLLEWGRNRWGT
jgi:hypothetical protein